EHEQRLASREREALEASEARMREREDVLKQREQEFRRRIAEELDGEMRRARREIDEVIAGLKAKTDALAREAAAHPLKTGDLGSARTEARAAVDATIARALLPHAEPKAESEREPVSERPPAVGDRVLVGMLGLEGVVTAIHDDSVEVDVRG